MRGRGIAACDVSSLGAHIAGYKQKAPPWEGLFHVLLYLFEQRHSHPSLGSKKEEKEGAGNSTIAHAGYGNPDVFLVNIEKTEGASLGRRPRSTCLNRP